MPIQPRTTRPCAMMSASTPRTMFTGMAKPMPSTPMFLAHDGGVDADQRAAGVDQRAARVAEVDRCIRLDEVLERRDPELLAAGRAHDP